MLALTMMAVPLITGFAVFFLGRQRLSEVIHAVGSWLMFALGTYVSCLVFRDGVYAYGGIVYMDSLSALILLVVSLIGLLAALYSVGYMGRELALGAIDEGRWGRYFLYLHLFLFSMLLVLVTENLGVLWVAVEGTTIISALLVGFYNRQSSVEAAWKYLIICTVGITFALFGTILTYHSSLSALGHASPSLNWTALLQAAQLLDKDVMKLAFIFILVGYGTKVGFAPMHTWLPDAHSQAPSPISGLLSGVLLNCAFYGLMRFYILVSKGVGADYPGNLLLLFGLLSIAAAVPFIAVQGDFKRLLAYSSVEHMGVIATGLGFGGALGIYGAILHLINHAIVKSMLFFAAGNLVQKYHSLKMHRIRGVVRTMPLTGITLILGILALTGAPPLSIFFSKLLILKAGFAQGQIWAVGLFLALLGLVFAGLLYHIGGMVFGAPSERVAKGELGHWGEGVLLLVPLAVTLVLGLYPPPEVQLVLDRVAAVFGGAPPLVGLK